MSTTPTLPERDEQALPTGARPQAYEARQRARFLEPRAPTCAQGAAQKWVA
jgi:hypothetical protein